MDILGIMPEFIVVQSKEDYDNEQMENVRTFFRIVWMGLSSFLFAHILQLFIPIVDYIQIFIALIVLFFISDFTRNRKIRSYIRALFAFLYGFCGILFILTPFVVGEKVAGNIISSILIGLIFLYISYNGLNKYTSLIKKLRRKFR